MATMPAALWPGTVQKSVYVPAGSFTVSFAVEPGLISGVLAFTAPPWTARSCWILPAFLTTKVYVPGRQRLRREDHVELVLRHRDRLARRDDGLRLGHLLRLLGAEDRDRPEHRRRRAGS